MDHWQWFFSDSDTLQKWLSKSSSNYMLGSVLRVLTIENIFFVSFIHFLNVTFFGSISFSKLDEWLESLTVRSVLDVTSVKTDCSGQNCSYGNHCYTVDHTDKNGLQAWMQCWRAWRWLCCCHCRRRASQLLLQKLYEWEVQHAYQFVQLGHLGKWQHFGRVRLHDDVTLA